MEEIGLVIEGGEKWRSVVLRSICRLLYQTFLYFKDCYAVWAGGVIVVVIYQNE